VTVAGTLALMWAETLGLVTAIEAAAPGAAVLACCGPGILDMRTMSMSLACLENILMGAASVDIGHHLGLPVHNSGLATDAQYPGFQAGYEKGLKALAASLAGADIVSAGFGALHTSGLLHLPMVPMDAEIAAIVRRLVAGAEITPETIMTETIERLGAGGNYLKEKTTRKRIRAGEHFYPTIGSRLPYEQWLAEGRMEADVARERVEEILAEREAAEDACGASLLDTDQLTALAAACGVDH